MPIIQLVYANAEGDPKLQYLAGEKEKIGGALWGWQSQTGHRLFQDDSTQLKAFLDKLGRKEMQDGLIILGFSGHAASDILAFNDDRARGQFLSQLLQTCPKLKLVLLNGCATHGHRQHLEKADIPLIITTTNAVGDERAKDFANAFFQQLAQGMTVEKAFRYAAAQVNIGSAREEIPSDVCCYRGAARGVEITGEINRWELSCREPHFLDWTLALGVEDPPKPQAQPVLFNKKAPSLDFAPLSCDRKRELEEWNRFFDEHRHSGQSLHFFFEGQQDDRPQSFVRRFLQEQQADGLWLDVDWEQNQGAASDIACLAFPNRRDCPQRLGRIVQGRRASGSGRYDYSVFFFELDAQRWEPAAIQSLKQWAAAASPFDWPLLCFYWSKPSPPPPGGGWLRRLAKRPPAGPWQELKQGLQAAERCFWWEQAWSAVREDDLKEWFAHYTDDFVGGLLQEWLQGAGALRMHLVEDRLRKLIQAEYKNVHKP